MSVLGNVYNVQQFGHSETRYISNGDYMAAESRASDFSDYEDGAPFGIWHNGDCLAVAANGRVFRNPTFAEHYNDMVMSVNASAQAERLNPYLVIVMGSGLTANKAEQHKYSEQWTRLYNDGYTLAETVKFEGGFLFAYVFKRQDAEPDDFMNGDTLAISPTGFYHKGEPLTYGELLEFIKARRDETRKERHIDDDPYKAEWFDRGFIDNAWNMKSVTHGIDTGYYEAGQIAAAGFGFTGILAAAVDYANKNGGNS